MQAAAAKVTRRGSGKQQLLVLNHVSGVLKPGRITLLLGPPASGKSSLLKALSGRLGKSGLKVCTCALHVWCWRWIVASILCTT